MSFVLLPSSIAVTITVYSFPRSSFVSFNEKTMSLEPLLVYSMFSPLVQVIAPLKSSFSGSVKVMLQVKESGWSFALFSGVVDPNTTG